MERPYYRDISTPSASPAERQRARDRAGALEERCVAWVLFAAGLLGVVLGLLSPRESALELVLGAVLVWLARRTARGVGGSSPT